MPPARVDEPAIAAALARRSLLLAPPLAWLSGCASVGTVTEAPGTRFAGQGWHAVPLPGKSQTSYRWVEKDGRASIAANADRSASMWRRKVNVPSQDLGQASFSWRVDRLIEGASVADADREDAPARVMFAFAGDVARLSARTRMMFELAHALTGEPPPYATLMYVWEGKEPVDSLVINSRTDRVRKIVLDSGASHLGRWRQHRRNLVVDFRRAFGEDPGPLVAIAVMTDADNTRSVAEAWYGPIELD